MTQSPPVVIAVVCADRAFVDQVKNHWFLRVESIYNHAINLFDDDDRLWTLVSRGMDDAPRTARLDVEDFGNFTLFPDQRLDLKQDRPMGFGLPSLNWNGTAVRTAQAPALALASDSTLADAAQLVRSSLNGRALGGSPYPAEHQNDIASHFARQVHDAAHRLRETVSRADASGLAGALDAAVGLGPGSTPSLDDYLVGIMLLASHPESSLHPLALELQSYLAAHPHKSTPLSMATLQTAAAADFRTTLNQTATALAEDPGSDKASFWINAVLEIGESSGSDILTGLLAGLELEQELRGCLWLSQL